MMALLLPPLCSMFNAMGVLPLVNQERIVFWRERAASMWENSIFLMPASWCCASLS